MLKFNNNEVSSVKFNNQKVNKVLCNDKVVWKSEQGEMLWDGDYNSMQKGFLPTAGNYPEQNNQYPNARYSVFEVHAGDIIEFSVEGSNNNTRLRIIKDNTVIANMSTASLKARRLAETTSGDLSSTYLYNAIIEVLEGFSIGIMYLHSVNLPTSASIKKL